MTLKPDSLNLWLSETLKREVGELFCAKIKKGTVKVTATAFTHDPRTLLSQSCFGHALGKSGGRDLQKNERIGAACWGLRGLK